MFRVQRVDEVNDIVTLVDEDGTTDYYNLDKFDYMPREMDEVVQLKGPHGKYFVPAYELDSQVTGQRPVNKLGYCLMAFFLGDLGIHEFYAGRVKSGLLHLAFCWTGVPAIVSLVEMAKAIGKPEDGNGNIYM